MTPLFFINMAESYPMTNRPDNKCADESLPIGFGLSPPVKLRITANMVTKLCQAEFTLPTDLTNFSNMEPEEIEELKQTPEKRADTIKTLCQSMLYQHLLPLVDPARGTRGVDYELPNPFSGHYYELEDLYNLRTRIMARFVLDCATDPTTRPT